MAVATRAGAGTIGRCSANPMIAKPATAHRMATAAGATEAKGNGATATIVKISAEGASEIQAFPRKAVAAFIKEPTSDAGRTPTTERS